jgi:hypothetical protein
VALDTVRVRVPVIRETWHTGFDDRRREGQGELLDDVAISRRNPRQLTDLLQGMRGVSVIATGDAPSCAGNPAGGAYRPFSDGVRDTDGTMTLTSW